MREFSEEEMDCISSFSEDRSITGPRRSVHLWEFLLELLMDETNSSMIEWTDEMTGEFKLKNSEDVAKKWGQRKHKEGMNYDKLSRALRYYYSKDIIKKVSGRRFVYKFVASPEMQAAVNAIKSHMMRGGVKHIPVGPFPHYHHHMHQGSKMPEIHDSHDVKPFMYNHSRPRSVSPHMDYERPPQPSSNSPPLRSRTPHRSPDTEEHCRQGSIILTHSNREQRGHKERPILPKIPPYYRPEEIRREIESGNDRKRRHSDRVSEKEERRHYRVSEAAHMRRGRPERRNSTNDYHPFHYKDASPTPDSRLSLYEENARKYAEERLKVLDRYAYARENNFYRRHEPSSRNSERRGEQNGHLTVRAEKRTHSVSPTPRDVFDPPPQRRATPPITNNRRSPPTEHHRLSPKGEQSQSPAIVLRSDYLPTPPSSSSVSSSDKHAIYHSPSAHHVHEPPVHSYMYRRYSPMIDASTQTGDVDDDDMIKKEADDRYNRKSPSNHSDQHHNGNEVPVSMYNGHTHNDKSWRRGSPFSRFTDEPENGGGYTTIHHQNGIEHHHHNRSRSNSPNSPMRNTSPIQGTPHCMCGCMDTIESPTASGTVVVYPKEIV